MKDLIIQALTDAFIILEKQIPQIKLQLIEIDIADISPWKIIEFMKENSIPDNAYFGGKDNGYDGFSEICLCYDINISTTDNDKLKFKRKRFSTIAFKKVFDLFTKNNYKRVGFNSGLLKEFDNTTIYDMFISNEFDRLLKYYSLSFISLNH